MMQRLVKLGMALLWIVIGILASAQCPDHVIAVLAYHRFDDVRGGPTTVSPENFLRQVEHLQQSGYELVPLSEVEGLVRSHSAPDKKVASITVDDGHESVYRVLFPIIRARQIPITLFIYPSIISRRPDALTWGQLRAMQSSQIVKIESHTFWHPDFRREKRRLPASAYDQLVKDQLVRSKETLERQLATSIHSLAWPYGIVDDRLKEAARNAGYSYAYGYDGQISSPHDDLYAIHRIPAPNVPGIGFIPCERSLFRSISRKELRR